jgi:hypothetical protein
VSSIPRTKLQQYLQKVSFKIKFWIWLDNKTNKRYRRTRLDWPESGNIWTRSPVCIQTAEGEQNFQFRLHFLKFKSSSRQRYSIGVACDFRMPHAFCSQGYMITFYNNSKSIQRPICKLQEGFHAVANPFLHTASILELKQNGATIPFKYCNTGAWMYLLHETNPLGSL